MSTGRRNWLSIFRPADDAGTAVVHATTAIPTGMPARSTAPPPRRSLAPSAAMPAAPAISEPPRLVLAVDATLSRAEAWKASQKKMAALFTALPGELEVALAVHGGSRIHTFTEFMPDAGELRRIAARIHCEAGGTRLLDILARVLALDRVRVVVYVGDVFEECEDAAAQLAEELRRKETRLIVLHDAVPGDDYTARVFGAIAAPTGGAVLPFDASALDALGAMLQAVAVLTVGGTELLETSEATLPAAPLLLRGIEDSKQLRLGGPK